MLWSVGYTIVNTEKSRRGGVSTPDGITVREKFSTRYFVALLPHLVPYTHREHADPYVTKTRSS